MLLACADFIASQALIIFVLRFWEYFLACFAVNIYFIIKGTPIFRKNETNEAKE
jgi:hypothetical protein